MLGGIGFRSCVESGSRRMLWRRVHGVELQWLRAFVDEVVPCSGGNKADGIGGDAVALAIEYRLTLAADKDECLVYVVVRLFANLSAYWDAHQHDLAMLPGDHFTAEIGVFAGFIVNPRNICHALNSFAVSHGHSKRLAMTQQCACHLSRVSVGVGV
jgi:hypothetical protein